MKTSLMRFLPALLFIITGTVAIFYNKDYWEAASWYCFAAAVLTSALPAAENRKNFHRTLSMIFAGLGILLLLLRLAGVLPVPLRPLPVI